MLFLFLQWFVFWWSKVDHARRVPQRQWYVQSNLTNAPTDLYGKANFAALRAITFSMDKTFFKFGGAILHCFTHSCAHVVVFGCILFMSSCNLCFICDQNLLQHRPNHDSHLQERCQTKAYWSVSAWKLKLRRQIYEEIENSNQNRGIFTIVAR